MKRATVAALLLAVSATASCGTADTTASAEPSASTATSSPAPADPDRPVAGTNQRGAIPKSIGEVAGVKNGTKGPLFEINLIGMKPVAIEQCTDTVAASHAAKGQWFLLEFDVTIGKEGIAESPAVLAKPDFYSVSKDGVIGSIGDTMGTECLDDVTWFGVENPLPTGKYQIDLMADVPTGGGYIGYTWDGQNGPVSWEWNYPG